MSEQMKTWKPSHWQVAAFKDKSRIMLCYGGAGGGKTRLGAEKCHAYALKYPGSTILILRKNRQSITNTIITFFYSQIWGPWKQDVNIRYEVSKHRFVYPNGSMIMYGGMADELQRQQIKGIGGDGGVDLIWMEEASLFVEQDFQEAMGRLRGRGKGFKQVMLTTNPASPHHWIYKRLVLGKEASCHFSLAKDNPTTTQEYLSLLDSMGGIMGMRLAQGLWVQAEGVVYPEYNHTIHHIDYKAIPSTWRRIRCIDFGYRNPFVCLWIAIDHDNKKYVYREIYQTGLLVQDAAKMINDLSQGEKIEVTIVDHDAEDRATLERYGISTKPAFKDVASGIENVRANLKLKEDGMPSLFFIGNMLVNKDQELARKYLPTSTEEEITLYEYDAKGKEIPIKKYDHGMDALRYGLAYIDNLKGDFKIPDVKIDPSALNSTISNLFYNF